MIDTGFTMAAVLELCRQLEVPIHVMWLGNKIDSFIPDKSD